MLPWAATRLAVLGDQGLLSVRKGSCPRWQGATHRPATPTPALPHRRPLLTSDVLGCLQAWFAAVLAPRCMGAVSSRWPVPTRRGPLRSGHHGCRRAHVAW